MIINFIEDKEPKTLRTNVHTEEYLNSMAWALTPDYLTRKYQCLVYEDEVFFSNKPMANGEIIDNFRINKKTNLIKKEIEGIGLPNNTLFIGGFYHEDYALLNKIVTSDTNTSLTLQQKNSFRYIVSDVLYFDGINLMERSYITRREVLNALFEDTNYKYFELIDYYLETEDKQEFFRQCEAQNRAMFFVHLNSTYYQRKQYRYTNPNIYHGIIMDINVTNKTAFSITVGMYMDGELTAVGNATGLTKEMAFDLGQDPKKYIGKVAKVSSRTKSLTKLKNCKLIEIYNDFPLDKKINECKW